MGLKHRLRRLEDRSTAGACPECELPSGEASPGYIVISDEASGATREQEWCPRCGRPLYCIIEVVLDEAEEAAEPGGHLVTLRDRLRRLERAAHHPPPTAVRLSSPLDYLLQTL